MRSLATLFLVALLVIGLAALPAAQAAEDKTHQLNAEFVSVDAEAKTITIKSNGRSIILPLEGKALEEAKNFKEGDAITITCRDDDSGLHKAVVAVAKAQASSEKKKG